MHARKHMVLKVEGFSADKLASHYVRGGGLVTTLDTKNSTRRVCQSQIRDTVSVLAIVFLVRLANRGTSTREFHDQNLWGFTNPVSACHTKVQPNVQFTIAVHCSPVKSVGMAPFTDSLNIFRLCPVESIRMTYLDGMLLQEQVVVCLQVWVLHVLDFLDSPVGSREDVIAHVRDGHTMHLYAEPFRH